MRRSELYKMALDSGLEPQPMPTKPSLIAFLTGDEVKVKAKKDEDMLARLEYGKMAEVRKACSDHDIPWDVTQKKEVLLHKLHMKLEGNGVHAA